MNMRTFHSPLTGLTLRALGNALGTTIGRNRVCVINYHRVLPSPEPLLASEPDVHTFRWHMELLARCFHVMPLQDALRAVALGKVPQRTVCITFDDGYRSIHELALPVLHEFGLPATVFVTSGYIGQGSMWNDRIIDAVQTLPDGQLDLEDIGLGTYPLRNIAERKHSLELLIERSKYLPPAARDNLADRLDRLTVRAMPHDPMLTREMIIDLQRHGIDIGAHTVSHPILTSLDDENARREIAGGKAQLEAILDKPVRLFAYPNGKAGKDFDERHVAMVREAGFDAAFTTAAGSFGRGHDPFQLPRSRPWDDAPLTFGLRLLRWLAPGAP